MLTNLTDEERVKMVKEYVKELGGNTFTAYNDRGETLDVYVVESSKKFKNINGKRVSVNKDLTSYLNNQIKQEAIALIDELIITSSFDTQLPSAYSHDWLDNYGKNDWEYWKTYLVDKQKNIWEATLNLVNSSNGEKILYDIVPIKKVEQSVTSDTSTTNNSIPEKSENVNTNGKKFDVNERKSKIPKKNGVTFTDVDEIDLIKRRLG